MHAASYTMRAMMTCAGGEVRLRAKGWRAAAVVLIVLLGGLPGESLRNFALGHDWLFDALDARPALLGEARKPSLKPMTAKASAEALTPAPPATAAPAATAAIRLGPAPEKPHLARLVPLSTGPPAG